uniref:Tryptophan-rich basic protein n=1 Tax=Tetraselmis chuii TaxID=63592 RepID=A0A7S1SXD0_9CHLO|mmetsp:Transcript_34257/g.61156  ORF Transcript_34257/g.61156 Transcript_34257/m.61156 type:complete len:180 (+) Transcript_34257:153-692(+)
MDAALSEVATFLASTPPAVALSLAVLMLCLAEELGPGRQRRRMEERTRGLRAEIGSLRQQAAALNTPATFAKCAKLERQAIAREKEVERFQGQLDAAVGALSYVGVLRMLKTLLWVGTSFWFWNRPLLYLPPTTLAPLGAALASPHYALWRGTGAVCALPFLSISYSACSSGIRRLVAY